MKDRLENIRERIKIAAVGCGRNPETIRFVAVSKTVSVERVRRAIEAGVTILGENYIQEAQEKIRILSSYPVSWHFIGHLQTNKAKYVVRLFDLIHSVDSLRLAQEINKQAGKLNKVQKILIQVNIGEENSKSGVYLKDAERLIREISHLQNLSVRGLMAVPPYYSDPEKVRTYFAAIRELRDQIKKENITNISMDELSMGMTGDFEVAIEEGSTLIRIGTAIFGKRN
ncbi:MAG TPA: YggS family pyridoxal phosphate-dependent enzyme [Flexilinea sp.]|nr:YggS family pyridoxal phosphate-dependent enzyme [Flexilinea sp.]